MKDREEGRGRQVGKDEERQRGREAGRQVGRVRDRKEEGRRWDLKILYM